MDYTSIIVAVLSSGVLVSIIDLIKEKTKKKDSSNMALSLLLLQTIKAQGREHIANGKVAADELEEFLEVYDTYKKLGGNGFAEKVKNDVLRLPLI